MHIYKAWQILLLNVNCTSVHYYAKKKLYFHVCDISDTAFSYEREFREKKLQWDFSEGKGSDLQLICNAHTAFLLNGADFERVMTSMASAMSNLKLINLVYRR